MVGPVVSSGCTGYFSRAGPNVRCGCYGCGCLLLNTIVRKTAKGEFSARVSDEVVGPLSVRNNFGYGLLSSAGFIELCHCGGRSKTFERSSRTWRA